MRADTLRAAVSCAFLELGGAGVKLSFPLSHFGHLRFAYCGTDIGEAKQLPS
jgi:hypothetical protein